MNIKTLMVGSPAWSVGCLVFDDLNLKVGRPTSLLLVLNQDSLLLHMFGTQLFACYQCVFQMNKLKFLKNKKCVTSTLLPFPLKLFIVLKKNQDVITQGSSHSPL